MANTPKSLFEYTAILHDPKDNSNDKVIVEKGSVLATNARTAEVLAARDIPEEHINNIDNIEIIIVPFR